MHSRHISTAARAATPVRPGGAPWCGIGAGDVEAELFGALPHSTNNVAEYNGLLAALDWCREHGATSVHVKSDSLLLVQQMKGVYKVKNEGLKPLYGRARLLCHEIGKVTFEHVRREFNKEADRLANLAMDEAETTDN